MSINNVFLNHLIPRLSSIADVISAVRQGGDIAFGAIHSVGRALTAFGVAQAGLMTISALNMTRGAALNALNAYRKNDLKTCALQAFVYVPAGMSYVALSVSMFVEKVATLTIRVGLAARAGNVMLGASALLSAFSVTGAIIELNRADTLSDQLQERKNQLSDVLILDEVILDGMIAVVKESWKDPMEFTRQTNDKCSEKVERFFRQSIHADQEKKKLLRAVFKANYKAQIQGECLFGNSTYGFFSTAVAFTCSGIAVPLAFGVGALFWLTSDSHWLSNEVGSWFWNQRRCEILPAVCQKESDKPEMGEAEFWIQTALQVFSAPIWVVPAVIYNEGKAFFGEETTDFSSPRLDEEDFE